LLSKTATMIKAPVINRIPSIDVKLIKLLLLSFGFNFIVSDFE